jgi:DNA-binding MarR family transcriptional regulator
VNERKTAQQNGLGGIVPAEIYNRGILQKMTGGEFPVYLVIRRHQKGGMTTMTLKELRTQAGVTPQGLRKILKRLREKGALKDYFRPGTASSFLRPGAKKNTWVFYT